jgi:hypothetical protein
MQMYVKDKKIYAQRLCIPLGTTLESPPLLGDILALHPLRNDFGASSPLLGGILALHSLRNDFGASSPLLGGILAMHSLRNDFGASSCFTLDGVISYHYILHMEKFALVLNRAVKKK